MLIFPSSGGFFACCRPGVPYCLLDVPCCPGEIYLSNRKAIYTAPEIPDITGTSQIAAVLDIEPKKLKKIVVHEEHCKVLCLLPSGGSILSPGCPLLPPGQRPEERLPVPGLLPLGGAGRNTM